MKRRILPIIILLVFVWQACEKEEENLPGTIYGVVTDKATGEPVKSAGVELSPVGLKTITGTEGQFEFTELVPGNYTLLVTKTGYADYASNSIEVKPGQTAQSDIQMELLPPALKVVDDNRKEVSELDFGEAESDVARSFNLFNDGVETLEWQITKTAEWITQISKMEGELKAGATQSLIVTIDRSKLTTGVNSTTIHITSNNGSKQLRVVATNGTVLATLNTLDVSSIKRSSAVFNGEILTDGSPAYTERGFVYSTSSMPTLDNTINRLTVTLTENKSFSATATGLTMGQTYYVRAYAINAGRAAYSTNEKSFSPDMMLPTVTTKDISDKSISAGMASLHGTITDVGDPAYTERGFVYGTMHNPTVDSDSKTIVSGSGTGEFSINLSELVMGKVYYVRAYATNERGTAYGEEVVLDMNAVMPEVRTGEVEIVDNTTAVLYGTIDNAGDPAYTERGFVYGTMLLPSLDNEAVKVVAEGTSTGEFNAVEDNLTDLETYNVRAYAKTPDGIVYGELKSFTMAVTEYLALPTFEHGGHTYRVYPDLGSTMDWKQAMSACENLSFGGYEDWILPDKDQLNTMYVFKDDIGGFYDGGGDGSGYWSSTEGTYFGRPAHYVQFFSNGVQNTSSPVAHVRPIRLEK